ncbi:MAG: AbrB/MazE/SpoVT family DNA-binding domain-containing protein [Acidobacteriaceae bacterium]
MRPATASSTISSKGQVTIPLAVRHRLGLKEGDRAEFAVEQGRTILRPVRAPEISFEKYVGALPAFEEVQQINDWVRSLRDAETARQ